MKTLASYTLLLASLLFTSCEETGLHVEDEYYITWNFEINNTTNDYFKVVNIHTNKYKNVSAVLELEGKYYLPVMSRWPTYHNKIVNGYFSVDQPIPSLSPDTVFKVTKHVRDTIINHGGMNEWQND